MEPVTLIATDLDGTFLNSKKQVSDLNREAVSKLKNHGILFGIASGRPVETVRAMLKKWKIEDSVSFIMGMNGGVVYDLRQRTKEEYHVLDGEVVLDVIHFFEDLDVPHVIQIIQVLKRRNMHEFLVKQKLKLILNHI